MLRHVARGLANREIAERLAISANTVRTHLDRVFDKTGEFTGFSANYSGWGFSQMRLRSVYIAKPSA